MTHHTQDPWEVMAHENGSFTVFESAHKKNWTDWSIAELNFTVQDAANARLIAAAPDLLDTLQRIAEGKVMQGEFSHAKTVVAYQELARAAINKAKGN
jgi:predicted SpoU family rRNA methylase